MYSIPYPFQFDFLMLSSEVLQKLGFEKHVHPHSIEWILYAKRRESTKMAEFCIMEVLPHFDEVNGIKSYIGTQFFLPRSFTRICFLHDLVEHIQYYDSGVMEVLVENAKLKDLFVYFLNYLDYKNRNVRNTKPSAHFNSRRIETNFF